MAGPGPEGRQNNKRAGADVKPFQDGKPADIKQIRDILPLQPIAGNEPADNEFELRIFGLFRLVARGAAADKLANSVGHVARSIATCIPWLGIVLGLKLLFVTWTAAKIWDYLLFLFK